MDLIIPTSAKNAVFFQLKGKMVYRLFCPKPLVQWAFLKSRYNMKVGITTIVKVMKTTRIYTVCASHKQCLCYGSAMSTKKAG